MLPASVRSLDHRLLGLERGRVVVRGRGGLVGVVDRALALVLLMELALVLVLFSVVPKLALVLVQERVSAFAMEIRLSFSQGLTLSQG